MYHDLHHLALESVLGFSSGFYGLVEKGWNITDFGTPWPRGPIPNEDQYEAQLAETVAALLDHEFQSGERELADGFNQALRLSWDGYRDRGIFGTVRKLLPEDLTRIRSYIDALHRGWIETAVHESLHLHCPVDLPSQDRSLTCRNPVESTLFLT